MALSDDDLRKRVVEAVVEGGLSRNAAASQFDVSIASVVRWLKRYETTGEISPAPSGGDRRSVIIGAMRDFLLRRLQGGSQEIRESLTRSIQAAFHRSGSAIAYGCSFLIRKARGADKNERFALFRRQLFQRHAKIQKIHMRVLSGRGYKPTCDYPFGIGDFSPPLHIFGVVGVAENGDQPRLQIGSLSE